MLRAGQLNQTIFSLHILQLLFSATSDLPELKFPVRLHEDLVAVGKEEWQAGSRSRANRDTIDVSPVQRLKIFKVEHVGGEVIVIVHHGVDAKLIFGDDRVINLKSATMVSV